MSITLPPQAELPATPHSGPGGYGPDNVQPLYTATQMREHADWFALHAIGTDRAGRPQTVPDELRAAAAAVIARWDSPEWKATEHTGVSIARLRAALEAVEAAPVAQAQPESVLSVAPGVPWGYW